MSDVIHRAELPIALTNGNDGRGSKWFSSSNVRKAIEAELRVKGHARDEPFGHPVKLRFTRVLGPRQKAWDRDSWQRGNLKEIIDALVSLNWFSDDSPAYIADVTFGEHSQTPRPTTSTTIVEVMLCN